MQTAAERHEQSGSFGRGPHVISIQSQVAYGHVGNSAAVFPMQALGVDVAAVPTTLLSNHPAYPSVRGRVLDAGLIADLLRGLEELGVVEEANAILTGYLGSAENGVVVADFITRAKTHKSGLLYVCDPVIGDAAHGVYVAEALVAVFAERLIPAASIVTPNHFELELLAGRSTRNIETLVAAAMRVKPRVVVTGCVLDDTPAGKIETIICDGGGLRRIATDRLDIEPNGAGDVFAGLLVAYLASGCNLVLASEKAAAGVLAVLQRTIEEQSYELRMATPDFLPRKAL